MQIFENAVKYKMSKRPVLGKSSHRMYIYTVSICSEKAVRAAASQIIGIQGSIVLKSNKPRQIARTTGSFFVSVATGS